MPFHVLQYQAAYDSQGRKPKERFEKFVDDDSRFNKFEGSRSNLVPRIGQGGKGLGFRDFSREGGGSYGSSRNREFGPSNMDWTVSVNRQDCSENADPTDVVATTHRAPPPCESQRKTLKRKKYFIDSQKLSTCVHHVL